MSKIKVSAISYLNTKPFLYGIEKHPIRGQIDLQIDHPAICAKKLINNEVDLGIVPVDVIPSLPFHEIVGDFCIGSSGAVKTVVLFSQVPLHEIDTIKLDYQSRSSVRLCQILAQYHWDIAPNFVAGKPGFENTEIQGTTAGVVIGDRVFGMENQFAYVYDLSLEWENFTKQEFVFATWTANKPLPEKFKQAFNEALKLGIDAIPTLTENLAPIYPSIDLKSYYEQHIDYQLSETKRKGMSLFWNYRKKLELLRNKES